MGINASVKTASDPAYAKNSMEWSVAKGVGKVCHCRRHHDTRGQNQPGLGESSQLGLIAESVETIFTMSLSAFLITWGQLQRFLSGQKLLIICLPILLTIYLEHFIAASIGIPSSAYILLRCLGTKNHILLAPGSRSVVLNPDCTLESPEGLLKTLMAGPHPKGV